MKKWIIAGILLVLLVVVAVNSVYTVEENQYACTFRFSEIINTESTPGLHFKVPFIDTVKYFSKATMLYDIPPSEVLTSDKQNMTVDCYILWSITGCHHLLCPEADHGYSGTGGYHQYE